MQNITDRINAAIRRDKNGPTAQLLCDVIVEVAQLRADAARPVIDPMQDPMRPTFSSVEVPGESPAEGVLRKLACWLGVGGYNDESFDAHKFHVKISWAIEEMAAERHQLQKDAARLDWIDSQWTQGVHVEACGQGDGTTWHAVKRACTVYGDGTHAGENIRAAIDAAMKGK